jgi:putative ABC transport system permease protein
VTRLLLRNLRYYWRINFAVVAGVAAAVAVLSGALIVGGSVRGSLRDLLVQRLGATDVIVASDRFFREGLAEAFASKTTTSAPMIRLQGVLRREGTSQRTRSVQVYGVDDRFWRFHGRSRSGPEGRRALVGSALAETLGISRGDTLLVRIETAGSIPSESLYGRRDSVGRTLRLTCDGVVPPEDLGEFALQPDQGNVFALFVPLSRLQRDLAQPGRINTVLVASAAAPADLVSLRAALTRSIDLQDLGVTIRPLAGRHAVAVESARILLDDRTARAAAAVGAAAGTRASAVFSYLANTIRANGREIPYSVITAADLGQGALTAVRLVPGTGRVSASPVAPGTGRVSSPPSAEDDIWLNEWASRELGVSPGQPVEVEYYRWQDRGQLTTETARFRLAGVVAIEGDVDETLAPEVPGISDARDLRAWDPPFPMDLRRIRPADEDYWRRYRGTPKAFVTLARGQQLWRSRFGAVSSIRLAAPADATAWPAAATAEGVAALTSLVGALRSRLDPEAAGFTIAPVRARGLEASQGSTDFGEYFVYFSFFLIAAAVLLAALFFRLGIEARVREIGTLQAVGFPSATIRRLFLLEGAIISGAGSLLGMLGAVAYGGALVAGLRTWWIGAVGTRRLFLHVAPADLAIGALAGVAASLLAILWALRALRHASPRAMLAGVLESGSIRRRRARVLGAVAALAFVLAAGLLAGTMAGRVQEVAGFFGAGLLLLVAMLSLVAVGLRRTPIRQITRPGWIALARLGARHVTCRPGRSLLCVALIAFASFVIVSVEAFRQDSTSADLAPSSGTGGFPLLARSALPIVEDPGSRAGREALGINDTERPEFVRIRFVPFRERPGEDASCLNLYAPQAPRILGASPAFVREGRFSFQSSLAARDAEQRNPWLLLEAGGPDDAIPAIADANTIQYILHRSVGDEIVVSGDGGEPVRLRLVAALHDSILQGELVIAEARFLRAFPNREGFRFFLLDAPPEDAGTLVRPLEESLADVGLSVEVSSERLAAYHRVENTYLSTFQSLGALGLVLGTFGLAAVLLRNVLERRRELALLRAVGYRGWALSFIIIMENVLLMVGGLACGAASALLAIVPALVARGGSVPYAGAGAMLAVVLVAGVLSSLVAVVAVWRMPLMAAIRSE